MANHIGSNSGSFLGAGESANNTNCTGKKILLVKEWCWDEDSPTFNVCGKSANLKVTGVFNEVDNKNGDARIRITATPNFAPQNVASDVLTWSYQSVTGNIISGTGQFCNDLLDLVGDDENDLEGIGVTLTGVSVINVNPTTKKIRLHGTITPSEIATAGGTFFMIRKNTTILQGPQYNPKEIAFYKQAISNVVQGAGYTEFTYNLAYTTTNKWFQFWIDQTAEKLNSNFFGANANVYTYNQIIKYNLVPETGIVTFVRTITFSDTCAPKIITKKVTILDAQYPFIQTSLVSYPVTIKIENL